MELCKRTCGNCGDAADQCKDHSSICAKRATGFSARSFCSRDDNKALCPFSCGECVETEQSELPPYKSLVFAVWIMSDPLKSNDHYLLYSQTFLDNNIRFIHV